jgi:N-acetylglutamate synthase-like GNAT family acetyltransferase
MHYEVRVARPEDAEGVGKLLQASYPVLLASAYDAQSLVPAMKLLTRANPKLLGSGTYYLAEDAGVVVGCGGWTRDRPGEGTVEPHLGHLRHFGTHPGWVRRGVGRAIYGTCEASAREVGVTVFECYSSLNAEGFYRSLDFRCMRR